MRREKPKEKNIRHAFNDFVFLWQKCECCDDQIRLESVWTFPLFGIKEPGVGNGLLTERRRMVCKECCRTIEQANDFCIEFNRKRNGQQKQEKQCSYDEFGLPIVGTETPMPKCKPPKPEEHYGSLKVKIKYPIDEPYVKNPLPEDAKRPPPPPPPPPIRMVNEDFPVERRRKRKKKDIPKPPPMLKRKKIKGWFLGGEL